MHGKYAESGLNTKVEENVEVEVGLYADDYKPSLPPKKHRCAVSAELSTRVCEIVSTEECSGEGVRAEVNYLRSECATADEEEKPLLDTCSQAYVTSPPECDFSDGLSLNTDIDCGSADKLSLFETYDNVSETGEDTEATPVIETALNTSSDCETDHIELCECRKHIESPWVRVLEEHENRRAREAVVAFGQQKRE